MGAATRPVQFPNEADHNLQPNVTVIGLKRPDVSPARGRTINLKGHKIAGEFGKKGKKILQLKIIIHSDFLWLFMNLFKNFASLDF